MTAEVPTAPSGDEGTGEETAEGEDYEFVFEYEGGEETEEMEPDADARSAHSEPVRTVAGEAGDETAVEREMEVEMETGEQTPQPATEPPSAPATKRPTATERSAPAAEAAAPSKTAMSSRRPSAGHSSSMDLGAMLSQITGSGGGSDEDGGVKTSLDTATEMDDRDALRAEIEGWSEFGFDTAAIGLDEPRLDAMSVEELVDAVERGREVMEHLLSLLDILASLDRSYHADEIDALERSILGFETDRETLDEAVDALVEQVESELDERLNLQEKVLIWQSEGYDTTALEALFDADIELFRNTVNDYESLFVDE